MKIFFHYINIAILCWGIFILNHPVWTMQYVKDLIAVEIL